jgi:hypothetical protein
LATASSASTRAALARAASSVTFSASISFGRPSRATFMPESNHKSTPLTRKNALALSGARRAKRVARIAPIYPVEHVGKLRDRDRQRAVGRRRP